MLAEVAAQIDRQILQFLSGNWEETLDECAYPFPIFDGDDVVVIRNKAEMDRALSAHQRAARDAGVSTIERESILVTANGQRSAVLETTLAYRFADGRTRRSESRRFATSRNGRITFDMLELRRSALDRYVI